MKRERFNEFGHHLSTFIQTGRAAAGGTFDFDGNKVHAPLLQSLIQLASVFPAAELKQCEAALFLTTEGTAEVDPFP